MNETLIRTGVYGICVTLKKRGEEIVGGFIVSDLKDPEINKLYDQSEEQFVGAMDAIESMVLSHAVAGIDITSPAYLEGIESTVEACDRKFN